jgi:hypothetical protein
VQLRLIDGAGLAGRAITWPLRTTSSRLTRISSLCA